MSLFADRLPLATLLAGTAIVLGCADDPGTRTTTAAGQPTARPSILIISIDTLRADHLGCYGDANAATPNRNNFV